MCDMFIQAQQASSDNSSSGSSIGNTAHHHSKKRKLDYNVSQPVIQHSVVQSSSDYQLDSTTLQQRYSGSGTNATFGSLHNNVLQKVSPSQQQLVRASTIKLLDTYQRCGQKVFSSWQQTISGWCYKTRSSKFGILYSLELQLNLETVLNFVTSRCKKTRTKLISMPIDVCGWAMIFRFPDDSFSLKHETLEVLAEAEVSNLKETIAFRVIVGHSLLIK